MPVMPDSLRGAIKIKNVPKSGKSPKCGLCDKRGGDARFSDFSQIQKSPNHPRGGGGGVKKIVDFFHFLGHFLF